MTNRVPFPLRPLEDYRPSPTSHLLVPVPPYKMTVVWPKRNPMGHLPDPRPWVECSSPDGDLLFIMQWWEVAALLEMMAPEHAPEYAEPCVGEKR